MLKPEEGGMFTPEQHPDPHISANDWKRGLTSMVEMCRHDSPELDFQTRLENNVTALEFAGFDINELRHVLAVALMQLADITDASKTYTAALRNYEHSAVASHRCVEAVQQALR